MYIVFEGIVGTGKTTHSKKLFDFLKVKYPKKEIVWTREPGGTEISQKIRKIVQGTTFNEEMCPECEAYLYASSRAQTLRTIVKPTLESEGIVISDRSFITSLAFQGYGRDMGIEKIMQINKVAIEGFIPDLVVFLDYDVKECISRTYDGDEDKFERFGADFFEKVKDGYTEVSKLSIFKNRWVNVKLENASIEKNFECILKSIKDRI
jgi:dTMP kinase